MDPDVRDKPAAPAEDEPKRRYEKPAILWREVIDVRSIAVGCAKTIPRDPLCGSGGPAS